MDSNHSHPASADPLLVAFVKQVISRAPDETLSHDIHGAYLQKWRIWRGEDGSSMLVQRFLRSDADPELHNHPWDNQSLLILGSYWEITPTGRVLLRPGDRMIRAADDYHRVEVGPGELPVSIFQTGPKIHAWGFLGLDGVEIPFPDFIAKRGGRKVAG